MNSYHISILRENKAMAISHMHYYVILDIESAEAAVQNAMGKARMEYPEDEMQLVAVKRNVKKIKPPVAPGQSFLRKDQSILQPAENITSTKRQKEYPSTA